MAAYISRVTTCGVMAGSTECIQTQRITPCPMDHSPTEASTVSAAQPSASSQSVAAATPPDVPTTHSAQA